MDNPVQQEMDDLLRALLARRQAEEAYINAEGKRALRAATQTLNQRAGELSDQWDRLLRAVESNRAALEAYLTTAPPPSSNGSSPPSLRLESTPRNPGVLWEKFNETKEGSHT